MRLSRFFLGATLIVVTLFVGGLVWADDKGSPKDAREMLERAVVALKGNEDNALSAFRRGADGFRDHDLYVFCARLNGKVDAHIDAVQIGRNINDLYDIDGVSFGKQIMATAKEGEILATSYMWPEPGSRVPAAKVTFFTKVGHHVCGVGYYK